MKNLYLRKYYLIMVSLVFISFGAKAQYKWFEGNNLNSVGCLDINKRVAVGGGFISEHEFSTILKTVNSGTDWEIQTENAALYGVSFADIKNGIAVGDNGTILKTTDGGSSWLSKSSGLTNTFYGIAFTDTSTCTAVGSGGRIIKTTDGGNSWFIQASGVTNTLSGVAFTDTNNGTAVGSGGRIIRTTDGGNNWSSQSSGTNNSLYGVAFIDLNNGIVVGAKGTILKTTDAGENWITVQSGVTSNLFGISFVDDNWTAVGEWGTIIRNGIVKSSGTTNRLNGVYFIDAMNGSAVGWFGTILCTTDGGNNWVNQLCNQIHSHHFIYNGIDRSYYVFLPQNYSEQYNFPLMFGLCGSGQTGQTALDASRICSVADTSGFIAVCPSAVGNYWNLSSDVGFFSALIDTINSNYEVDLSRVYAAGMSLGGYMSHELGCKLPDQIAAIAPVAGTIQSSTISNCLSSAAPPVLYMHGTKDNSVSYSGAKQTLNFWIDRNQSNVSVDSIALTDIDTTDNSTVIKYSYKDNMGVARVVFYKIINGGHTWPGMNHDYAHLGNTNMDINASQEIWNFVKDFSLDTTTTDVNEISKNIPEHFQLFQNYPNPFNPTTTIKYFIPGVETRHASSVLLKVYDILGNEIATLVNEEKPAGSYEVTWNAEDLSSGVYFYQLNAGDFTATKKLLLLK